MLFPRLIRLATLATLLGTVGIARAGSVITTNLPADVAAIVNIDARTDGAASFGPNQSSWFQPFGTAQLTLGPGTYSFDLTSPTDALTAFPALTTAQRGSLFTAWTYNAPWITDYFVFDSSALTNSAQPQLFCGATGGQGYGTPQAAYDAAKTSGISSQIRTGPGGRLNGVLASSYTLTQTQTLYFVIPDNGLSDNGGGLSVVVKTPNAVPEPATLATLTLGALGLLRRRRAR